MKYLLDTNVCIRYLNGRSPTVFERLDSLPETDIALCSIVKFELRYGTLQNKASQKAVALREKFLSRFVSLPFDDKAEIHAAQIRLALTQAGTPIGPYDLLIAAIALANDLILVTHNLREFQRIAQLKLEDWETNNTSS